MPAVLTDDAVVDVGADSAADASLPLLAEAVIGTGRGAVDEVAAIRGAGDVVAEVDVSGSAAAAARRASLWASWAGVRR